jgi:hypothetical protein
MQQRVGVSIEIAGDKIAGEPDALTILFPNK